MPAAEDEIRRVVTVFRELRSGVTGRRPDRPSSHRPATLSAAEAISVITSGLALSAHFGDGTPAGRPTSRPGWSARWSRTRSADSVAWTEYLEVVARNRPGWAEFYSACREVS